MQDDEEVSEFCKTWPDDTFYCDGPLTSADRAQQILAESGLVPGASFLVGAVSSRDGALTPDGQHGEGTQWTFYYAGVGGEVTEFVVGEDVFGESSGWEKRCPSEAQGVEVDDLSELVRMGATLLEAEYSAAFVPGNFSINARRWSSCLHESGSETTEVTYQWRSTGASPEQFVYQLVYSPGSNAPRVCEGLCD